MGPERPIDIVASAELGNTVGDEMQFYPAIPDL